MPSTPRSLVKFPARASSVGTGPGSSSPAGDQVPQETNATAPAPVAGTATTADAVSCEATVVTGVPAAGPVWARAYGSRCPAGSPGARSGGSSPGSIPGSPGSSRDPVRPRVAVLDGRGPDEAMRPLTEVFHLA
ncbi:hypothetical protein SNE510_70250 [Streptomyces sp. NE5-10]|uniref:hypothetical protein n=1 Tax=Streptomyces sp. NE5-10 TaxID=2759674 RepID=UPI001A4266CF|nr:hypothetical protein SNE510_70250 [Streptomyces sp. NE5-10]